MTENVHFADRREQTVQVENVAVTVFMNAMMPRVLAADQENWVKMMLHEHAHWEIFGCIKGKLFVQFAENAVTLVPGDVLLIRPHVQYMSKVLGTDRSMGQHEAEHDTERDVRQVQRIAVSFCF